MHYSEIVKTETFVKKTVSTYLDKGGPCGIYFSVDTHGSKNPHSIDLVIGASYKYRCASALDKESLKELIDILVDIHEAMV